MLVGDAINWTTVIVVGIPANIAALGAAFAAILSARSNRYLRTGNNDTIGHLVQKTHDRAESLQTPSGDPIGSVAERTHDITHATVALVQQIAEEEKTGG